MKITNPKSLTAHLETIPQNDWDSFFGLIGEAERTGSFGELKGGRTEDGSEMKEHGWKPAPVVEQFQQMVYRLGLLVHFDWMQWDEGKSILDEKAGATDYHSLDAFTLCKLITVMVRGDRFHDGFLVGCFQNGIAVQIMQALKSKAEQGEW
ncbi:MAG: DUF6508 domain-containing protein [Balneolaceae bacterium]